MSEVQVAGHTYRIGQLNTFDQLAVASPMAVVLMNIVGLKNPDNMPIEEAFAKAFVAMSAGSMSADAAKAAIKRCLTAVQRKEANDRGWSPVVTGGNLMYQDLGLKGMLALVWHVVNENGLRDFFAMPPSATAGEPAAKS